MNWSGGKDSALALHRLQREGYEINTLLTTVSQGVVSMHEVPISLIRQQASAMRLPLIELEIPQNTGVEEYRKIMVETFGKLRQQGVTYLGYGDIFLEDLRQFRENLGAEADMSSAFPLWKEDTRQLLDNFIHEGFKTMVTSIDSEKLPDTFLGEVLSEGTSFPEGVDPCGEHGEFHTFVFDGPIFTRPVQFALGEVAVKQLPRPNGEGEMEFHYLQTSLA